MILYGPPGTGKTLHAQRAALTLLDETSSSSASNKPDQAGMDFDLASLDEPVHPTPPKGGLSPDEVSRIEQLQKEGRLGLVVFHPAYEYE